MLDIPKLNDPWLVAAWPGMGRVALTAGEYLAEQLSMPYVGEYPLDRYFEANHLDVKDGLASPGRRPRGLMFAHRHGGGGRDLLLLLGEAQPQTQGYALCQELIEQAQQWGVSRIVAVAAMATQMHPNDAARVFGVATEPAGLDELKDAGVTPLEEGQISGLNGLTLVAAQQAGLEGICLLGELPYFAAQVPNPKASRAVLGTLAQMIRVELDFENLDQQAERIDRQLVEALKQLHSQFGEEGQGEEGGGEETFTVPRFSQEESSAEKPALDTEAKRRIEDLFKQAETDRAKAFELKRELDRLGVFDKYEDRFLDLFKRGE